MKLHNVEQQTDEWFQLRLEHPLTASKAQAIATGGKGLETLVWERLAEKYSKGVVERYSNEHTDRGNELEPQARSLYELETGSTVVEVGFVTNDKISKVGGVSPDGLVGDDGLLEIKCFADTKHFQMVCDGVKVESQYEWQCQMQMLFTGRKWVDFVAYNPNYERSLLIVRIEADEEKQARLMTGLKIGEKLIKEIENKLK